MPRAKTTLLTLALAGAAVFAAEQASAQTQYGAYYTGPYYSGGYYAAPANRAVRVVNPAPRVYAPAPAPAAGYVYVRPGNCGMYHYWDGAQCLDARETPPNLDRERPID